MRKNTGIKLTIVVLTAVMTAGTTSAADSRMTTNRRRRPPGEPAASHSAKPPYTFSSTMMPMSTIVPIAIAMPASDITLASTPNTFIAMNDINTAIGSVMAITMLARTCNRNKTITAIVIRISYISASDSVATVSSINTVRS